MSLEGSQIPAEARIGQLMARIDHLSGDATGTQNAPVSDKQAQNFQAMVSMMQSQMYGEALTNPDDKDSSNPIASMFGGMNSMQGGMGGMAGMMGSMNPEIMTRLMQAGMMGGDSGMNPAMMMPTQSAYNPANMINSQLNTTNVLMPVQGKISSEYGHREHPISGHDHFHSGIDIAAPRGTPIRMPWEGKVVYVGNVQGFGPNTVIVAHENQTQADGKIIYSVFGHNDNVFVSKGQHLGQGEILGTVGSEGHSTGPHLHWETRVAEPGLSGTEVFNKHLSMTVNPMNFA